MQIPTLVSYNSCDNAQARVVVTAAIRPPKRGEWLDPAKTIPITQKLLLFARNKLMASIQALQFKPAQLDLRYVNVI